MRFMVCAAMNAVKSSPTTPEGSTIDASVGGYHPFISGGVVYSDESSIVGDFLATETSSEHIAVYRSAYSEN